jgi:TolA-binding protein
MAVVRRWICLLAVFCAAGTPLLAASSTEENAFRAAARSFGEMVWDRAETEFAGFIQTYTNSTRIPEAILYQAEARFRQTNYSGTIELLTTQRARARGLGDQFLFLTGEAYLRQGNFPAADETFSKLSTEFSTSPRLLEAAVEQATARAQLQQWPRVVELLARTNGVFQAAASRVPGDPHVIEGYLLLAKAYLSLGETASAGELLARLAKVPLAPADDWQRLYLLCGVLLAQGHSEEALQTTTNLLAVSVGARQPRLKADSVALQAGVLERLGRLPEAIAAYTNNLAEGTPRDSHREALLKVVELSLKQNTIVDAAQTLERYLGQYTNAPAEDLAWLTLGELRLRQCASLQQTNLASMTSTNGAATTNCLDQALTALKTFTGRFPQSPLLGRAQLDLGWCYWLGERIPESEAAFASAVEHLAGSPQQATAYFKLADAFYRQGNFGAAITNYRALSEKFSKQPEVETHLLETALYQVVRAGLEGGDLAAATNAMAQILADYPNGFHAGRALLLTGQAVGGWDPAAARKLFSDYAQKVSDSSLRPELELAIARTYEEENRWPEAISEYDRWLASFTNHVQMARAEYSRAWANWKAGFETNAFLQFTNFLARFEKDSFAPLAQWWIADYFRRQGDFPEAEKNYKYCYQNTNWSASTELAYQARMMAGRCAVARAAWGEAKRDYFRLLINDPNCPPDLQAQAWFAFGNASMSQISLDSTNKAPDYSEAINAFDKIPLLFPTNPIAVLALGEKACCLLQLSQTAQDLSSVTNAFQKVIDSPLADARARSIAKVGLAITLEKLAQQSVDPDRTALFTAARDQYLDVLNGNVLRAGEPPDPFWTKEAGLKVSRLLGDVLKQRVQAIKALEQLQKTFPILRLQDKIDALKLQDQQAQR